MRRLVQGRERPRVEGLRLRRAQFEDVDPVLRLIERAVEAGCRRHYDREQRRAVFLGYAQSLFVEVLSPLDLVVGEARGTLVGAVQVDARNGHLRGLFVDAGQQGHGYGARLLEWALERTRRVGSPVLGGMMSLNAVPFYSQAGFLPVPGRGFISHAGVAVPVVPMRRPLD